MFGCKKIQFFIIYFLIFLLGFNFKTQAVLYEYILCGMIFLCFNSSKRVSKNLLYVIGFYVSIIIAMVIYYPNNIFYYIIKFFSILLLYYAFYSFYSKLRVSNYNNADLVKIFVLQIFFFNLGNISHMIADMMITDMGAINTGRRIINDIWTGGTVPTTIIVGWGCLIVPVLLWAFENKENHRITLIVSIILETIYITYSFKLATRLGILNSILIVVLFYLIKYLQGDIEFNIKAILKIILLIGIVFIFSSKITEFIMNSNLFTRMSKDSLSFLDSNGRMEAAWFVISHFTEAMWGGEYFTKSYGLQQHNIVFQVYDLYGILAFIFLNLIIYKAIGNTFKIYKSTHISNRDKRFVVLLFLALVMYLFEEPAFTSNFVVSETIFIYLAFSDVVYKDSICQHRSE